MLWNFCSPSCLSIAICNWLETSENDDDRANYYNCDDDASVADNADGDADYANDADDADDDAHE